MYRNINNYYFSRPTPGYASGNPYRLNFSRRYPRVVMYNPFLQEGRSRRVNFSSFHLPFVDTAKYVLGITKPSMLEDVKALFRGNEPEYHRYDDEDDEDDLISNTNSKNYPVNPFRIDKKDSPYAQFDMQPSQHEKNWKGPVFKTNLWGKPARLLMQDGYGEKLSAEQKKQMDDVLNKQLGKVVKNAEKQIVDYCVEENSGWANEKPLNIRDIGSFVRPVSVHYLDKNIDPDLKGNLVELTCDIGPDMEHGMSVVFYPNSGKIYGVGSNYWDIASKKIYGY